LAESLVLASASPRRAQILRALGVSFRVVVSGADETLEAGEDAAAAAERLARAKAAAVARSEPPPILAADWMAASLAGKSFPSEKWYVEASGRIVKTPL